MKSQPFIFVWAVTVSAQSALLQLWNASSLPMLSTGCVSALTSNLSCNYMEVGTSLYQFTDNFTSDFLNDLCTAGCASSIASYRTKALQACKNDVYNDTANSTQYGSSLGASGGSYSPIVLPDYYFTNYQQRCLKDRYGHCE
jgi:hypothetical protein